MTTVFRGLERTSFAVDIDGLGTAKGGVRTGEILVFERINSTENKIKIIGQNLRTKKIIEQQNFRENFSGLSFKV
jgi:hypothetical protein